MRHLQRDGVHLGQALGIKSQAARIARERIQRALGHARLAPLFLVQQADAIDQHFVLLRPVDQLFQADSAGVVVAVGDHQQNFLLPFAFLLQIVIDMLMASRMAVPPRESIRASPLPVS